MIDYDAKLKQNALTPADYVLVSKEIWEKLIQKFGGGPEIPLVPQIHPVTKKPFLFLSTNIFTVFFNKSAFTREVPLDYRIGELKADACDYFGISKEKSRLFNYLPNNGTELNDNELLFENKALPKPYMQLIANNQVQESVEAEPGMIGITNLGNTCYANSVLQCIAHIKPVADVILRNQTNDFVSSLSSIIKRLTIDRQTPINPIEFLSTELRKFYPKDWISQQDAEDFFRKVINKTPQSVQDVFNFKETSNYTCVRCNSSYSTNNLSAALYLSIPNLDDQLSIMYVPFDRSEEIKQFFLEENIQDPADFIEKEVGKKCAFFQFQHDSYIPSVPKNNSRGNFIAMEIPTNSLYVLVRIFANYKTVPKSRELFLPVLVNANDISPDEIESRLSAYWMSEKNDSQDDIIINKFEENLDDGEKEKPKIDIKLSEKLKPNDSQPLVASTVINANINTFYTRKQYSFNWKLVSNTLMQINIRSKTKQSISDMIKHYFHNQTTTKACERCRESMTSKLQLDTIPEILVVNIKRFEMVSKENVTDIKVPRKNVTPIIVDPEIDISQYVSGNFNSKYELVGEILHSGNLNFGHYTAKCKKNDGSWVLFNDEYATISKLEPDDGKTYILFYQHKK